MLGIRRPGSLQTGPQTCPMSLHKPSWMKLSLGESSYRLSRQLALWPGKGTSFWASAKAAQGSEVHPLRSSSFSSRPPKKTRLDTKSELLVG